MSLDMLCCTNIINGCHEKFKTLQEEREHRKECKFRSAEVISNKEIIEKLRPSQSPKLCEICDSLVANREFSSHIKICSQEAVLCDYCRKLMERKDLKNHKEICPDRPVSCPFEDLNCKSFCSTLTIEEHQNDVELHFPLLCNSLKDLHESAEILKYDNKNKEKKLLITFSNIASKIETIHETNENSEERVETLKLNKQNFSDPNISEQNLNLRKEAAALAEQIIAGTCVNTMVISALIENVDKDPAERLSLIKLDIKKEIDNLKTILTKNVEEKKELLKRIAQLEGGGQSRVEDGENCEGTVSDNQLLPRLGLARGIFYWEPGLTTESLASSLEQICSVYPDQNGRDRFMTWIHIEDLADDFTLLTVNGVQCQVKIHLKDSTWHQAVLLVIPIQQVTKAFENWAIMCVSDRQTGNVICYCKEHNFFRPRDELMRANYFHWFTDQSDNLDKIGNNLPSDLRLSFLVYETMGICG